MLEVARRRIRRSTAHGHGAALPFAVALFAVLALAACGTGNTGDTTGSTTTKAAGGTPASGSATVSGQLSFAVWPVPNGALAKARLVDTTDSTAAPLGEQAISTLTVNPTPFRISYNPAAVNAGHSYSVNAEVGVGNTFIMNSMTPVPVITMGNPTSGVTVQLSKTGS